MDYLKKIVLFLSIFTANINYLNASFLTKHFTKAKLVPVGIALTGIFSWITYLLYLARVAKERGEEEAYNNISHNIGVLMQDGVIDAKIEKTNRDIYINVAEKKFTIHDLLQKPEVFREELEKEN